MLSDARDFESKSLNPALRLEPHDLAGVVLPIARMMDRFSDRHPVMLMAPDEPVWVDVDAERLQRALENLVSNAIKYSPNGGAIEVSIDVAGDTAVLRVRDHGIGISAAALPHVFDRAFRAPEASAHAPGLGLGLNIVAQVIAGHGGTIDVESGEGKGTVMIVKLPLAPERIAVAVGEPARQRRPF
jgi:signal transduction histidine kinase